MPEECVGLESNSVWGADSLKERIEDYFAGRKNWFVELSKVLLSSDDPRFNCAALTLNGILINENFIEPINNIALNLRFVIKNIPTGVCYYF